METTTLSESFGENCSELIIEACDYLIGAFNSIRTTDPGDALAMTPYYNRHTSRFPITHSNQQKSGWDRCQRAFVVEHCRYSLKAAEKAVMWVVATARLMQEWVTSEGAKATTSPENLKRVQKKLHSLSETVEHFEL